MEILSEDRLRGFMEVSVTYSFDLQLSINDVAQCTYAMSLLHLAALLSTKLSIVLLLRNVSPSSIHKRLCLMIGCFMVVWTLVFEFLITFQCKAPKIWNTARGKCIDKVSFFQE